LADEPASKAELTLRQALDNPALIESLESLRRAVSSIWSPGGPRIVQDYTDHGLAHSARVAQSAVKLLDANRGRPLSPEESYLLLAGIYLHDIGMQCDVVRHPRIRLRAEELGAVFDPSPVSTRSSQYSLDEQKSIRKNHQFLSAAWIDRAYLHGDTTLGPAARTIPSAMVGDVMDACLAHTSQPISACPSEFEFDPTQRKRFVAAILRFADELDIAANRVDIEVIKLFSLDPENEIYWWLHHQTDIIFSSIDAIQIIVKLQPDDHRRLGLALYDKFVRQFLQKNEEVLQVLRGYDAAIIVDRDSGAVPSAYAQKLPPHMAAILAPHSLTPSGTSSGGANSLPNRVIRPNIGTEVGDADASEVSTIWDVLSSKGPDGVGFRATLETRAIPIIHELMSNQPLFPRFTDHSSGHAKTVIAGLSWVIPSHVKSELSALELSILILAAHIRELVINSTGASDEGPKLRNPQRIRDWLEPHWTDMGHFSEQMLGAVAEVVAGSAATMPYLPGPAEPVLVEHSHWVHVDLLAAYLAISDLVAFEHRTANYLLLPEVNPASRISDQNFAASAQFLGIRVDRHRIKLFVRCKDPFVHKALLSLEAVLQRQLDNIVERVKQPYELRSGALVDDAVPYARVLMQIEVEGFLPQGATRPRGDVKVFVSHSHFDGAQAIEVYRRLRVEGFTVWLDIENLNVGQDWQEENTSVLNESDVVLVLLSQNAVSSAGIIQREIDFSLRAVQSSHGGGHTIIPVRIEDVPVPAVLSNYHWVNLFQTDGMDRLIRALDSIRSWSRTLHEP
jgi:TIR domain